jgi:hypothetical protein
LTARRNKNVLIEKLGGHILFEFLLTQFLQNFTFSVLPPHSGRYETFLCNYEKNIFLALSDDSKNILENRFFNQTSS